MKRLLFFLLITISLSLINLTSCEGNKEKNDFDLLKDYFSTELLVSEKNDCLSFVLSNGKITVISPEILKDSEILMEEENIKIKTAEYEIRLPEGFSGSLRSFYSLFTDVESNNFSDFKSEHGKIIFKGCELEAKEDGIILKTNDKEYILQKRTKENEKDFSRS